MLALLFLGIKVPLSYIYKNTKLTKILYFGTYLSCFGTVCVRFFFFLVPSCKYYKEIKTKKR